VQKASKDRGVIEFLDLNQKPAPQPQCRAKELRLAASVWAITLSGNHIRHRNNA
jgi:hypothetical protein